MMKRNLNIMGHKEGGEASTHRTTERIWPPGVCQPEVAGTEAAGAQLRQSFEEMLRFNLG